MTFFLVSATPPAFVNCVNVLLDLAETISMSIRMKHILRLQVWPAVWLPALSDRLPWLAARAALVDSLVLAPPVDDDGEVVKARDVTAQAMALRGLEHLKVQHASFPALPSH